jgi:hypothetical protein
MPSRALERRPDEAAFLVKARLRDDITAAQAQGAMRGGRRRSCSTGRFHG